MHFILVDNYKTKIKFKVKGDKVIVVGGIKNKKKTRRRKPPCS